MAKRTGGFIGQDGINAPDPATGVTGTAGNEQVSVSFTAPSDVGGAAITGYSVQSNDGSGEFPPLSLVAFADKTLDYSSQASSAWGFALGDSGTKAYVLEANSVIYQYTLSTAYDLSTASYASKSEDISGTVTTGPRDITFKPDGTKFYVSADDTNDRIFQFSLSTAWDITTSSYDSLFFDISGQDTTLYGFTFNSDGTKIVAAGSSNDTLFQYSLSTAYNISTASYDSVSFDVGAELSESAPLDVSYNSDGTVLYLAGNGGKKVYRINLSTAYDLSTASYDDEFFATNTSGNTSPYGLFVKPDEQSFFVLDFTDDLIYQYDEEEYPTESPVTITGLTNGTSYTFNVWAINPFGWSSPSDASGAVSPNIGDRGLIAGGRGPSGLDVSITYITISTSGSDADFGDLSTTTNSGTGLGSSTRGVIFVDKQSTDPTASPIEYVTFATKGDTTDFGDLAVMSGRRTTATSNETRGLFMGQFGDTAGIGANQNAIAYITIASAGNAQDFGDLTRGTSDSTNGANAACSSTTRAILGGGGASSPESNVMDYVTIASTGNATDFGDLTIGMNNNMSCSSSTRGVWAAGISSGDFNNTINYVTIASTGNAADFGDMTLKVYGAANGNLSNKVYGMFAGGDSDVGDYRQQISYITIASTGNTSDFGDLSTGRSFAGATSNAHGGLS